MEELLRRWNIGHISAIEPISRQASLVRAADGRCFVLKGKPDLTQAEREANLLSSLSDVGAPVATPLRTVDGAWHTSHEGKVYCLYPWLPGEIIDDHYAGDAAGRANAFGKAIGFLHTCLSKCDSTNGFRELKLVEQLQEWAIPSVRRNRTMVDGSTIERIWEAVGPELSSLYGELPKQLIHRDPHPANMLFDAGSLTGFVDFEMVVRGPRIFDVCYCGSSILVGGFQDSAKVEKWPSLFRSLARGYQQVYPLTSPERRALYGVFVAIQLLFVAFSFETQAADAAKCNASVLKWLSANRELISL